MKHIKIKETQIHEKKKKKKKYTKKKRKKTQKNNVQKIIQMCVQV